MFARVKSIAYLCSTETRERSGKSACLLHSHKSMYNFWEYYNQKSVELKSMKKFLICISLFVGAILFFSLGMISEPFVTKVYKKFCSSSIKPEDPIYSVISPSQQQAIDGAIKITFTGDLILLRDMVERAYIAEKDSFGFDKMFEHVKEYLADDDLSIGVFEGPVASADKSYSTSCFDDKIPLYLNFPESFASAVKHAGIDYVTTSNNHLLDQRVQGCMQTLDVLDSIHLNHSGSYRSPIEHDQPKIINVKGLKIGVLTFTYGSNHYNDDFFFQEEHEHITCCVMPKKSKYYKKCKKHAIEDFKRLKSKNPDVIIVLPHMGKQFNHAPDNDQKAWCDFFVEQGADIIFSDHPHAVQPIEWRKNDIGKNVLIVHCPGNYVNSYIEHDGDASIIAEAYLNPKSGEPFAASCIPLYSYCKQNDGMYQAIPLYKIIKVDSIYNLLSAAEYKRIEKVHKLITKTALGAELSIDQIQQRYFTFADAGYVRLPVEPMVWEPEYDESKLIQLIKKTKNVCFVGNSITEGTKNGGYGWYEPLVRMLGVEKLSKYAKGGETSIYFNKNRSKIANMKADLYVISVGCNDIRYRNPAVCAMNAEQYINNIDSLVSSIRSINPYSDIVCISPWLSYDPDPYCKVSKEMKLQLYDEYTTALERYCMKGNYLFINPNEYIHNSVRKDHANRGKYFKDHIHPNANQGILLFSKACVMASLP